MKNLNMATKIPVSKQKNVLSPSSFGNSSAAKAAAALSSATLAVAFKSVPTTNAEAIKSTTITKPINCATSPGDPKGPVRLTGPLPEFGRAPLRWEDEAEELENMDYNDEIAAVEGKNITIPQENLQHSSIRNRRLSPFDLGHHEYVDDDGYESSGDEKLMFEENMRPRNYGSQYSFAYPSSSSMSSGASAFHHFPPETLSQTADPTIPQIECIHSNMSLNFNTTKKGRSMSLYATGSPLSISSGSDGSLALSPRFHNTQHKQQRSKSFGGLSRFKSFTDRTLKWEYRNELKSLPSGNDLVKQSQMGVDAGYISIPVDSPCTGGVYFLKGSNGRFVGVLKPCDEEAYANHNPNGYISRSVELKPSTMETLEQHASANSASSMCSNDSMSNDDWGMKPGIRIGEAALREAAAFILDHEQFAGVPNTTIVTAKPLDKGCGWRSIRRASLQAYATHECSAEDIGPSFLPANSLHRIAVLDIRLYNMDRHPGNILLRTIKGKPAQSTSIVQQNNFSREESEQQQDEHHVINHASFGRATSCEAAQTMPTESTFSSPGRLIRTKSKSFHESEFNSTSDDAVVTLLPIDHGYCLPSIYNLGEVDFAWMQWEQTKLVVDDYVLDYVLCLDPFADCEKMRSTFGPQITEDCFLTLVVCTLLLRTAMNYNISLYDVGTMICQNYICEYQLSIPEHLMQGNISFDHDATLLQQMIQASGLPSPEDIQVPENGGFLDDCDDVDWINIESSSPSEPEEGFVAAREKETMDFLKRFQLIVQETLRHRSFLFVDENQSWPQARSI